MISSRIRRRSFLRQSVGALAGLSAFAGLTGRADAFFFFRRSHGCGCGGHSSCGGCEAPSCTSVSVECGGCGGCAPAPSCGAPAPSCCAPAPSCCAPPPPSCCAPAPSCGAPAAGAHGGEAAPAPAPPPPPAAYNYRRDSRQARFFSLRLLES